VAPVVQVTGDGDEIGAWLPDQKYASVGRRRAAHEFAHVDGGRRLADELDAKERKVVGHGPLNAFTTARFCTCGDSSALSVAGIDHRKLLNN
jgi:hypothetical protein